jgi:hypothetical protein
MTKLTTPGAFTLDDLRDRGVSIGELCVTCGGVHPGHLAQWISGTAEPARWIRRILADLLDVPEHHIWH